MHSWKTNDWCACILLTIYTNVIVYMERVVDCEKAAGSWRCFQLTYKPIGLSPCKRWCAGSRHSGKSIRCRALLTVLQSVTSFVGTKMLWLDMKRRTETNRNLAMCRWNWSSAKKVHLKSTFAFFRTASNRGTGCDVFAKRNSAPRVRIWGTCSSIHDTVSF